MEIQVTSVPIRKTPQRKTTSASTLAGFYSNLLQLSICYTAFGDWWYINATVIRIMWVIPSTYQIETKFIIWSQSTLETATITKEVLYYTINYQSTKGMEECSLQNIHNTSVSILHQNANTGRSCFMPGLHSWKMLFKFKTCKPNMKFPFKTVYFLEVRALTYSSFIVYSSNTSGYKDLQTIFSVYTVYIHFYTIYFIYF